MKSYNCNKNAMKMQWNCNEKAMKMLRNSKIAIWFKIDVKFPNCNDIPKILLKFQNFLMKYEMAMKLRWNFEEILKLQWNSGISMKFWNRNKILDSQ